MSSKVQVRAPSEQSQIHERLEESDSETVNLCAAAAFIVTGTSTCFASNDHSIPAAPALRMPASGGMVGVKFSQRGRGRVGLHMLRG